MLTPLDHYRAWSIPGTFGRTDRILHGDALEHTRLLEDQSIGMVMTDPPFFDGLDRADSDDYSTIPWSDVSSIESAASWCEPIMHEFRRVTRPGGAVAIMVGTRAVAPWMLAAQAAGLIWMATLEVIWNEGRPRLNNFGSLHSHILWFMAPGARHSWNSSHRSIYSNVIVCNRVPRSLRIHPTQKPIELTTFLVSILSNPIDIILDPFCGSGSALVSAEICDRLWIGIDNDRRCCNIARRRVSQAEIEDEDDLYLWNNGRLEKV